MTNIFTYGTLMVPSIFLAVSGKAYPSKKAVLSGYARYRVKMEDYPGIIVSPGDRVEGVVYFDVDDTHVHRLDLFENEYFYYRTAVSLAVGKKMVHAEAYVIKSEYRQVLSNEEWDFENFKKHHQQVYLDQYSDFW